MYTKAEFEELNRKLAKEMAANAELRQKIREVVVAADRYNWMHQTRWMGETSINPPEDLFAFQEIIYQTRPKFLIECGVAWAGTLLLYASLLEAFDIDGHIIGIDIYIPDDLKERIRAKGRLADKITLINGSTLDPDVVAQVRRLTGDSTETFVHLDSNHEHDHVLQELEIYSEMVGKGHYLICGDTFVEDMPEIVVNRPRPWGKGNNPKTAVREFLKRTSRFEVDEGFEQKMLFTCNPQGFLRCIV